MDVQSRSKDRALGIDIHRWTVLYNDGRHCHKDRKTNREIVR